MILSIFPIVHCNRIASRCHLKLTLTRLAGSKVNFPSFARHVRPFLSRRVNAFLTQPDFPEGLGDNPFIRMVSAPRYYNTNFSFGFLKLSFLVNSQSKSLDGNAERARGRSPCSAGTRARACASRRRSSAKLAQRRATCARRVSSTSSTTSRPRSVTPRSVPRTRPPRATSTGSTTRRIRKPRYVSHPLPLPFSWRIGRQIDANHGSRVVSSLEARTS